MVKNAHPHPKGAQRGITVALGSICALSRPFFASFPPLSLPFASLSLRAARLARLARKPRLRPLPRLARPFPWLPLLPPASLPAWQLAAGFPRLRRKPRSLAWLAKGETAQANTQKRESPCGPSLALALVLLAYVTASQARKGLPFPWFSLCRFPCPS